MAYFPLEVLEHIFHFAVAQGTADLSKTSYVSIQWRGLTQQILFRSIRIDPFDSAHVLYLDQHRHLTAYTQEIHITGRSHPALTAPNHPLAPFTNLLQNIPRVRLMILGDQHIDWVALPLDTIHAFFTVFSLDSFRSFEISSSRSLPSWLLLYGAGAARKLTIHHVTDIASLQPVAGPIPLQQSLEDLALLNNASICTMINFLSANPGLVGNLFQGLTRLSMQYVEIQSRPPIAPHAGGLLEKLGSKLKALTIHVMQSFVLEDTRIIPGTSLTALRSLQRLDIRITVRFAADELTQGMTNYTLPVLRGLPTPSPLVSFSLELDAFTPEVSPESGLYSSQLRRFAIQVDGSLQDQTTWPCLRSVYILANIRGHFESPSLNNEIHRGFPNLTGRHVTVQLLVNTYSGSKAETRLL